MYALQPNVKVPVKSILAAALQAKKKKSEETIKTTTQSKHFITFNYCTSTNSFLIAVAILIKASFKLHITHFLIVIASIVTQIVQITTFRHFTHR